MPGWLARSPGLWLPRWLLMSQHRTQRDPFRVKQGCLVYMPGVRRVGLTTAPGALQRAGLIEDRRGLLAVRDRAGLQGAGCSRHAADCRVDHQCLA